SLLSLVKLFNLGTYGTAPSAGFSKFWDKPVKLAFSRTSLKISKYLVDIAKMLKVSRPNEPKLDSLKVLIQPRLIRN
ncbi:MAG: hypothetical protein ABF483_01080, partial [Liquorilactobacillus nagelii]|uniref:hypothetical protein n=1 Tax=Liquorilactobacillus nagelii TaxID=82688 RepID=UPI0039E78431